MTTSYTAALWVCAQTHGRECNGFRYVEVDDEPAACGQRTVIWSAGATVRESSCEAPMWRIGEFELEVT